MKNPLMKSLLLLTCIAAATGCGKSSPMGPEAQPAAQAQGTLTTYITYDYVVVHNDGDLIGNGEFEFYWGLNSRRAFTSATLGTGDVLKLSDRGSVDGEGSTFSIYFEASEWDSDILGNDFRDPDMDKRSGTKKHTVAPELNGQYSITLGNSDCKVQFYYTLETVRTEK